jgi:hypothetical protein
MSTRTSTLGFTNVSDASFRLWINEIHNSLIAFGWVQTSDTGQINYSTVTRPAGTSTYQGFAVYRMADSLQSTCAVFMRLDYGTGGTTDGPSIKVTVCIGSTDGAGTLTGNVATQFVSTTTTANATLRNCRTSGTTSRFSLHFWSTVLANAGFTFAVERDLDSSGAEVGLGVNFITSEATGNNATSTSQFLELAGGTGPVETRWYAMVSSQTSQAGGGVVGVGPVRNTLGVFRNPMKSFLVTSRLDFTIETTATMSVYGSNHTYLILRPNLQGAATLNTWQTDCGMAMLWE